MNWVTIKRAAHLSGYTEDAIRAKIADGTWLEGTVWCSLSDGRIRISCEGYDAWVEGRVPRGVIPRAIERVRRLIGELRARPQWADPEEIARIYEKARAKTRATGIPHSVDHVIPRNHPLVCGLHVPENLRVITASENSRKSNRWVPA